MFSSTAMIKLFSDQSEWRAFHTPYPRQWLIQDFPEEGAPTRGGAPTYDFAKFFQKLHEIERIWTHEGGASLAPLDPPLLVPPDPPMQLLCPQFVSRK